MSDPNETRVWPSGERTTRAEADAKGLRWATVCLYTEPEPTDCEHLIAPGAGECACGAESTDQGHE